jgi:hypothetical protein
LGLKRRRLDAWLVMLDASSIWASREGVSCLARGVGCLFYLGL